MAVVHGKGVACNRQLCHRRIGAPSGPFRVLQPEEQRRQQGPDGKAVGHNGHLALGMPPCDFPHHGLHAPGHLTVPLRTRQGKVRQAAGELLHLQGIFRRRISEGAVLPGAHVNLPQPGIRMEGKAPLTAQHRRRFHGPAQVTGIDRLQGNVPKPLSQGLNLPQAQSRNPAVILPLHPAVKVPLRLPVANEIKGRHLPDLQSAGEGLHRLHPMAPAEVLQLPGDAAGGQRVG